MPEKTILLKLVIDGKDAIAELNLTEAEVERLGQAFGATTGRVDDHKRAMGGLAGYIREQRSDQARVNFLINDFREALNLAGLAMNGMAMGGSRDFRQLTDSVNAGLVAFNGIDAITGLLPGPMGLVLKLAGGIATAVYTWTSATEAANEALRDHYTLISSLNDKYDQLRAGLTGTDASIQALAQRQWEISQRDVRAMEGFVDELLNGQRVETTVMGQRVEVRRKGLTSIRDLESKYLAESRLYWEEYRKAQSEGKKGTDAHAAAIAGMESHLGAMRDRLEGLRVLWQEGFVVGAQIEDYKTKLADALMLAMKLGDFQMHDIVFISDEQAKRFAEATKQTAFLSAWMKQPPDLRGDLVQENQLAWLKKLSTIGKAQLKEIPQVFHGMTEEMKQDLASWLQLTNQVMSVFTNSVRTGLEAAFKGEEGGLREFFKSVLLGVIDLVQGLLLAAVAAAELKGVLTMFASLAGDFTAIAAATVGLQTLRAFVATAFAEGGVVTRPTLALIGERGETELVVPQGKLERFLREQLLPEVMRSENFLGMARQGQMSSDGGGLASLRREIRSLHSTLKAKEFTQSFPGLVSFGKAFEQTAPRVARQKARERK